MHGWLQPRLGLLILIILAARPIRASYRHLEDFLPGPARSALHNSMSVFSFFDVKTLQGHTLQPVAEMNAIVPYRMTRQASPSTPRRIC